MRCSSARSSPTHMCRSAADRRLRTTVLACALLNAVSGQVLATSAHSIQFTLVSSSTTHYWRAPLAMSLVAKNTSQEPVRASLVVNPMFATYCQILYRRVPGDCVSIDHARAFAGMPVHPELEVLALAPGEERKFDLVLAVDAERARFVFDEPGQYEIKLRLRLPGGGKRGPVTETPPLAVSVVAPGSSGVPGADWTMELAALAQRDNAGSSASFFQVLPGAVAYVTSDGARFLAWQEAPLRVRLRIRMRPGVVRMTHR